MDLTPLQRSILADMAIYGADKAENIGARTGYHRNTVSARLNELENHGMLSERGGGVYELTDSGRSAGRELLMTGFHPYIDESDDEDESDEE